MPQRARAVREGEFLSTAGPDSPEGQEARDSRLPPMDTLLSPTPAAPPSWGSGARPAASAPAPLSPSFVRQADRAAFWRRPAVRAGLLSLALLLSLLLAAQAAHTWRDRLAAQVPALEPALALGCEWLGCDIGPARALPALSVESSGLVRVERSNLYKLQVSLRNRAPHPVAVPALDLTLTDARGELVARRVILLTELGLAEATIPPGRDVPLQATLQSTAAADGTARVIAGYTVELFYP
jgi:hypothetical protein